MDVPGAYIKVLNMCLETLFKSLQGLKQIADNKKGGNEVNELNESNESDELNELNEWSSTIKNPQKLTNNHNRQPLQIHPNCASNVTHPRLAL